MSTASAANTEIVNYSQQINQEHRETRACLTKGCEHAWACGVWLLKQKAALPYGQWRAWLKKHCEFSHDTADRYMSIARLDVARVRQLTMTEALMEVTEFDGGADGVDEKIELRLNDKVGHLSTEECKKLWDDEKQAREAREATERQAREKRKAAGKQTRSDEFHEYIERQEAYYVRLTDEQKENLKREQAKAAEAQEANEEASVQAVHQAVVDIVKVGYRELAKQMHPDMGGSTADMQNLGTAKEVLKELLTPDAVQEALNAMQRRMNARPRNANKAA